MSDENYTPEVIHIAFDEAYKSRQYDDFLYAIIDELPLLNLWDVSMVFARVMVDAGSVPDCIKELDLNLLHDDSKELDVSKEFEFLKRLQQWLSDQLVKSIDTKEIKARLLGRFADGAIDAQPECLNVIDTFRREYRCIELNEAGFLKAMPFIGGRKSREGQRRLVDQFLLIRKQLDRQSKMRESLAYQVARSSGKDSRAILTDAIQEFIEYARAQGSQNADRYYGNITKAVYASMLILEPQATEVRELLTAIQLSTLSTLELIAAQVLTEAMEQKLAYKTIFREMKKTLEESIGSQSRILT